MTSKLPVTPTESPSPLVDDGSLVPTRLINFHLCAKRYQNVPSFFTTQFCFDRALGQSEHNAWKASDEEFLAFAQSIVHVKVEEGDTLERSWTWEERRDFVNWCIDEGVLLIEDGRLIPVEEEQVQTASLSPGSEANAQERAKDVGIFTIEKGAEACSHE